MNCGRWKIWNKDMGNALSTVPDNSFDACLCDPPYGYNFMGKGWDHGVPSSDVWAEVLRVLKPGAFLLAFGGTRTSHRLVCAIEDAGFEVRDSILWLYGCLSEDTEILVDGQWVPYHKAIAGRHALCYNAESDEYSWQPIEANYVYQYNDTAYRIQSDHTDQIVSRNHRCLVERGGRFVFKCAETLERQEAIPILEGVQDLLGSLPVPHQRTNDTKTDVFPGVCRQSHERTASEKTTVGAYGYDANRLCSMWQEGLEAAIVDEACCQADLLLQVQRGIAGQRVGKARLQGLSGRITGRAGICNSQDEWIEEPCMERRSDILPQTRELQANKIRSVSAVIQNNGKERRLHHGTPAYCSEGNGTDSQATGSGASHQPRPAGQSTEKPATLCVQSRSQAVRASRYTRTDLARVMPIHYRGVVWCVRVLTGAFVARRNGKIFVTGNSGFPKSHAIGKAIDKASGAEREVVGSHTKAGDITSGRLHAGSNEVGVQVTIDHTAPATPLAKLWDGFGTALKPAHEPVCVAMKPLDGTFCENAVKWGVAGLAIDACRISAGKDHTINCNRKAVESHWRLNASPCNAVEASPAGRWPANVIHDGSDEVLEGFPDVGRSSGGINASGLTGGVYGEYAGRAGTQNQGGLGDTGSAARFFQCCPSDLTCVLCGLTLDISCGIINETQLQPKEPSSCDAQSAKNSSSPSGSQASSVATSVQGKPLPPKEDKQDKSPTLASNAESSSRNTSAISEPTVVRNAGTSHSEQFAQNVKSAASLCDTCTTVIVRELVEAKTAMHNGGGLQAILDCMPVSRKCIPIQGLVCFVEKWESIDIIPTTKSLTRLFGCVHHATNDCTPKTERSAPSRFAYHAKSSRLERNMGCEGLVAKERTTQGRDIVRKIDRRDGKGKVSVNAQIRPSTNHHPTVKSLALTKYLATLCLPPKRDTPRRILVPFSGSGSEMIGCLLAGWDRVLGVENDVKRGYVTIAKARLVWWQKQIERHGLVEPGELLGEVAPTAKKRKGGFGL